jgi:hypothetical protein
MGGPAGVGLGVGEGVGVGVGVGVGAGVPKFINKKYAAAKTAMAAIIDTNTRRSMLILCTFFLVVPRCHTRFDSQ